MSKKEINFGTFDRDPLADKVADRILDLIKEKHLLPGDRLPPERELAEMMGVSRPVLRSALRTLSIMKIVENRHRSGTYITSLEPELLVEHLEFVFELEDPTYLQLVQARKVVEPGLAEMAAQNASEEDIQRLEECLDKTVELINNPHEFLLVDMELHTIISNAAQNFILSRFINSIMK